MMLKVVHMLVSKMLGRETTPRTLLSRAEVLKNVKSFFRTSREAGSNRPRSNGHPFFERNWGGFDDGDTLLRTSSFIPIRNVEDDILFVLVSHLPEKQR